MRATCCDQDTDHHSCRLQCVPEALLTTQSKNLQSSASEFRYALFLDLNCRIWAPSRCGLVRRVLQVGVGEVVGNPLAHALEQAVRSHGKGDIVELEITGGEYKPELVFKVPTDHPEVERLQGRYKTCAPLPSAYMEW